MEHSPAAPRVRLRDPHCSTHRRCRSSQPPLPARLVQRQDTTRPDRLRPPSARSARPREPTLPHRIYRQNHHESVTPCNCKTSPGKRQPRAAGPWSARRPVRDQLSSPTAPHAISGTAPASASNGNHRNLSRNSRSSIQPVTRFALSCKILLTRSSQTTCRHAFLGNHPASVRFRTPHPYNQSDCGPGAPGAFRPRASPALSEGATLS
jgi:hypothetical protein